MSAFSIDGEKALRFQHERITKNLFKKFLIILEDLEREHNAALGKLYDSLPEQYRAFVVLADYLDEEKAIVLRKKVLDFGNDSMREFVDTLNQFDITVK